MDTNKIEPAVQSNRTSVARRSDHDVAVTRRFNAPASRVFEAWTQPELFKRWWVPKSSGAQLLACEMDVRGGGGYRLEFGHEGATPMAFFGRYIDVVPHSRLAWTNEEIEGGAVTTVTFEEQAGQTLLVFHERYPSKEALDFSCAGMEAGLAEQFAQLDELLASLIQPIPQPQGTIVVNT